MVLMFFIQNSRNGKYQFLKKKNDGSTVFNGFTHVWWTFSNIILMMIFVFFSFPVLFLSIFYSYTQFFYVITNYSSYKSIVLHEIRTRDPMVTSLVTHHCTTLAYRNRFWYWITNLLFQIKLKQNHALINYMRDYLVLRSHNDCYNLCWFILQKCLLKTVRRL